MHEEETVQLAEYNANKKYKAKDAAYNHFRMRLQERYGMDISRQEYNQLCTGPYIPMKLKDNDMCSVGVVGFNNKLILVVKSHSNAKVLKPCLPPKGIRLTMLVKDTQ